MSQAVGLRLGGGQLFGSSRDDFVVSSGVGSVRWPDSVRPAAISLLRSLLHVRMLKPHEIPVHPKKERSHVHSFFCNKSKPV